MAGRRMPLFKSHFFSALPMETLGGPDGSYVLQSHTVSDVPSSTVLYHFRTLRRPVEPQMAFLGIGAVPYDLEPRDTAASQGIMRAVSRGIYDLSDHFLIDDASLLPAAIA